MLLQKTKVKNEYKHDIIKLDINTIAFIYVYDKGYEIVRIGKHKPMYNHVLKSNVVIDGVSTFLSDNSYYIFNKSGLRYLRINDTTTVYLNTAYIRNISLTKSHQEYKSLEDPYDQIIMEIHIEGDYNTFYIPESGDVDKKIDEISNMIVSFYT